MNEQAQSQDSSVTSEVLTAAERKRRQRDRDRALLYERDDWRLFLDLSTLPQKAGCQPSQLRKVVLKELVDNQLDATGGATLEWLEEEKTWVVNGNGTGPSLSKIPKLFCVNRPLVSSKLKRTVSRGLLGNGLRVVMGAVHALHGSIIVCSRGHQLTLEVDPFNGLTKIANDDPFPANSPMMVRINLGEDSEKDDGAYAWDAICAAGHGTHYTGPSSPWWYGPRDFHMLLAAAPENATVNDVVTDLGLEWHDDKRLAKTLTQDEAKTVWQSLCNASNPVPPEKLGRLGQPACSYDGYGYKSGLVKTPSGAHVPYVIEAWANARSADKKGISRAGKVIFLVNRTPAVAPLYGASAWGGIQLQGCGMDRGIELKSARYEILLSILTPYVQLAGDGKEPVLPPFGNAIEGALRRACNAAYRLMDKPIGSMSIKEAAYKVMEEAYLTASGNGELPANARQIMYAARPAILRLTRKKELDDQYFTQTILPDFLEANPELTADWKVVYDARGHFIEPHTHHEIGLGTLEVDEYLRSTPTIGPVVSLAHDALYPTRGPLNRYHTVLFVEKEGFAPLLEAARIAERFDVGIMSTKGMSVVAARRLLDELSANPYLKQVLVLHDFDVYGFSIFGTLFGDTRRYTFTNTVPVIDLGFRFEDIEGFEQEFELEAEPYEPKDWNARMETLERHGASEEEIEFLETYRVELNALTAPQFIEFLEGKLKEHAQKVVPEKAVIETHARRVWEQVQAEKRCKEILEQIHAEAVTAQLPTDLVECVKELLETEPALSWDQAVAKLLGNS